MDVAPSDRLIRSAALRAEGWTSDRLTRAVRAGRLVRIRRGWYCLAEVWADLDERDRHLVRVAAVVADVADPLAAGRSAAAVWDLPIAAAWPSEVELLHRPRSGGRSEPGVRRTVIGAEGAPRESRLGIPATPLPRTAVDLAARWGIVAGLMAMDRALALGASRDDLRAALATRSSRRGAAHAAVAIELADAAAESPGESFARGMIWAAGFEVPSLQAVFVDHEGAMRTDFHWAGVDLVGEYDGRGKYERSWEGGDAVPAQVVWEEKRREDRLRRLVGGVVRLTHADVSSLVVLSRRLVEAGVPRRR